MNNAHDSESQLPGMLTQSDLRQLDLLVDGELEPAAQKVLLAKIDAASRCDVDEPWRQVALAYVESQAWRSDFGPVGDRKVHANRADVVPVAANLEAALPVERTRSTRGSTAAWAKALLAMAACGLVAFAAGHYTAGGDEALAPSGDGIAAENDGRVDPTVASREIEPIVVPIFVNNPGRDPFADGEQPVMPLHLIEALEQAGQPMQAGRTLVPIQLEDGTEISLPVAELKLRLDETSRRVNSLREKLESVDDEASD